MVSMLSHLMDNCSMLLERLFPGIHYQFHVQLSCLIHSVISYLSTMVIWLVGVYFVLFYIFSIVKHEMLNSILLELPLVYMLLVPSLKPWMIWLLFHLVFLSIFLVSNRILSSIVKSRCFWQYFGYLYPLSILFCTFSILIYAISRICCSILWISSRWYMYSSDTGFLVSFII